jgi:hypothetical protein
LVDYDSESEIDGARSSLLQEQRRKKMSEEWVAAELSGSAWLARWRRGTWHHVL